MNARHFDLLSDALVCVRERSVRRGAPHKGRLDAIGIHEFPAKNEGMNKVCENCPRSREEHLTT
jgi:hypothetical protein